MTRTREIPAVKLPSRNTVNECVPDAIQINNYIEDNEHDQDVVDKKFFSMAFGQTINYSSVQPVNPLKKITTTIIRTKLLIPGDGEPLADAALVIENKLIAWVGSQSDIPSKYTDGPHKATEAPYLMPGLWDCHLHFAHGGEADGTDYIGFVTINPATNGARLARDCWNALQNGYTSVRDLGGMGCELATAINEGTIAGPNVYSAGGCISQTGGHGDAFSLPAGTVLGNLGVNNIPYGFMGTNIAVLADGVDECRRATRLQIRRGAKCIKILASGGVLSRDDDVTCAQYSEEELRVIVEEARRQKRSVAAHVHAKEAILAAVKAGVTSTEHNSFADEECICAIKEQGIVYVSTRYVVEMLLATGGKGLDPASWRKAQFIAGAHWEAYKLAVQHGCDIALGSDTQPGDAGSAKELELAVRAGMTNLQAIKAATATAPRTVAGQAPKTGQLKVGYEADILGVLENPVEDVRVLQNNENIHWVWKGGKLFKGPGIGPWGEE